MKKSKELHRVIRMLLFVWGEGRSYRCTYASLLIYTKWQIRASIAATGPWC